MNIGLIDVDGHNWPNLALMKISGHHKSIGDTVTWWNGFEVYDIVYMSKIFDETYSGDMPEPLNARQIIKGGTGYVRRKNDELQYFANGSWVSSFSLNLDSCVKYLELLPSEIEHTYPDYSIYPRHTADTAFGYLTRGCPNNCPFCIVSQKEGFTTYKVAELSEFWRGQRNIKLMDANLLACKNHVDLLEQLIYSKSYVDFTQGLDCRRLTDKNIDLLSQIKIKEIHFAWDMQKHERAVIAGLKRYRESNPRKMHGVYGTVYVLTNFDTSHEYDLFRVNTLKDMGYNPYIMIYDKPNASQITRDLQRWVNNRRIFRTCKSFEEYSKV